VDRVLYTQLCFTTFEDGIVRNGYITSMVIVDEKGDIDSRNTDLENPIHRVHDGNRKGIIYGPMDHRAYRLNASWDSTMSFVQSLLNT
jgi:hypothetical protein